MCGGVWMCVWGVGVCVWGGVWVCVGVVVVVVVFVLFVFVFVFVFYLFQTLLTFLSDICLPGSSSSTGVAPCNPCLLHSYQPGHGRTGCIPCPDGKVTITTGSTDESQCIGNVSVLFCLFVCLLGCLFVFWHFLSESNHRTKFTT